MTGFFILQRRFSVLGHAIAVILKKKYGVDNFSGYSVLRRAERFLKSQKEIKYDPLIVDEDLYEVAKKEALDMEYIKELEKEYGIPNLWPLIGVDRHLTMSAPKLAYPGKPACSYEEMLKHLQVRFKSAIKMFKEKKPDFAVFPVVGSMRTYVLYRVAEKMGIPIFYITHTRIGGRITVNDNCYENLTNINKIFESIRQGTHKSPCRREAIESLEKFRQAPKDWAWEQKEKLKLFSWLVRVSKGVLIYFKKYFKESQWKDPYTERPFGFFKKRITRHLRRLRGYGEFFENPRNERFVLYPLHEDPEVATLLLAPFHVNQLCLIQNIAKSLPADVRLYVKEHPAMLHNRSRSFYKELKKIPNLRMINPSIPSTKIINKAEMVLTITGTAGWEATLFGKPVITFGSVFYNKLSQVKQPERIEKLPYLIKECLEKNPHDEQELIDFLSAIFEDSTTLNLQHLWYTAPFEEVLKDKELNEFVDYLAKKIGLHPLEKKEGGGGA